jgi:glycosyltransferase involved in cell wall biosynthesis/predicted negative regulator of RcsB-dependent stress response
MSQQPPSSSGAQRTSATQKIVGISMVKNEQDVIEAFVRHNLTLLDYLIVLDNGSVDDTKQILAKLSSELKNLAVIDDTRFGYTQSERMTGLLRQSQALLKAGFVIPLDADEFLDAADKTSLLALLNQIPHGGCALIPWCTFVLTPESVNETGDPLRSMVWRRRDELPRYHKVIIRLDGDSAEDLVIEQGNHNARAVSGREIPLVALQGLRLLHYPVRGREQFVAKSVVGWMAYLARDRRAIEHGQGVHWRENFDRIATGSAMTDEMLCERSMLYAQRSRAIDWKADVVRDAPKLNYTRAYSSGAFLGALELIARSWEQSLKDSPQDSEAAQQDTAKTPAVSELEERQAAPMAKELLSQGKADEALKTLETTLAKGETSELWNDWATIQFTKGDVAKAEGGYCRALVLDGKDRQAAVNLCVLLLTQSRLQEGVAVLQRHGVTLSEDEVKALRKLAADITAKPVTPNEDRASFAAGCFAVAEVTGPACRQPAKAAGPKLSIVMPTNRASLSTCARVFDACACADEDVEVIIHDNSGDSEKRKYLSAIDRRNCNVVMVAPCNGRENYLKALSLTKGEFVFYVADDDVLTRPAIEPVMGLIKGHFNDASVAGITGTYLVEGTHKSALVRYPPLDSTSVAQRVQGFFSGPAANALNYAVVRRSIVDEVMLFGGTLPYWFSYTDQLISLMYLAAGRFLSINRVLYQYDTTNWDTVERAMQSDLNYFRANQLDGSMLRVMWLFCGLEGAKIVLNKFGHLSLPEEERQAAAGYWFRQMYDRFIQNSHRTDPASKFDSQAVSLSNKWKNFPQDSLEELLADLCEFLALSNKQGAERYAKFWGN